MNFFKRFALASAFAALAAASGGLQAASVDFNSLVGQSLDSLSPAAAERVLTRYAEGGILEFAPAEQRIEFLKELETKLTPNSTGYERAELLIESAQSAHPQK